jgi:hypothetical protein
MSEAFFEDPYGLCPEDLVAPEDFDERLRPLVLLYEIGKARAETGDLPHHSGIGNKAVGVLLDDAGKVVRMALPNELPLVVPTSTRSGTQVVPHLGADDLATLLSERYRDSWRSDLELLGGVAALSLSAFIASLPVYNKRTKAQKDRNEKPDPVAIEGTVERLTALGLMVDPKQFVDEVFEKIVVLNASGVPMSDLPEWRARHIGNQSSNLASGSIGRCSITGQVGPLARLTGSVQGPVVSAIASSPGGKSAVVSVHRKTFAGLYRDGLRDASLSVVAAELVTVGLKTMLSESSVPLRIGGRLAAKRKATFTEGKGTKTKTTAVGILTISERHGTNAPENLLTALQRTVASTWVPERVADDGSIIQGFYETPDLDRLDLLNEATVLFAAFGGSGAGISFDSWHEISGIEAANRIMAWSKAQQFGSRKTYGFAVRSLSPRFAIGGGFALLRSITHGEPIPAWMARSALDELFKPAGLDPAATKSYLDEYLSILGLFLLGTDLNNQENIMTSLRDTPAFRLGAWLGAIQTAWEKGVGEGKQDRGPVSGIRSLASKPGLRWAELTFRYEESIGPKAPRWADISASKAASAFLDLGQPFPETLTTIEQATFVLGYQSRWEKAETNQQTEHSDNEATTP